jgi:hypothetical protein
MACTNIRFSMMWLSKARQLVTLLLSTFVVGGYFYDYRSHGCADYLPGIFCWMKAIWDFMMMSMWRGHAFSARRDGTFYCFQVISNSIGGMV